MTLNPAFASAATRKLPLAFGYILGQGDQVLSTVAQDGSQYALYILGEGEWDGIEMANTYATATTPSHLQRSSISDGNPNAWKASLPSIVHFHSGAYSVKGAGNQTTSVGPDQGYDAWFPNFPSPTPPQCFSGIAYAIWGAPGPPGFNRGTWIPQTITGVAVWRTTRCRIFDAYGNVVSYGFTCNPAWHRVEAILRYKIKPQQPPIAGLTDAEKACFNWASIAAIASRNDYVLSNGSPRFVGNYIFAADATLTNILELSRRCDRSYGYEDGGQIVMRGDDPRSSVFTASAKHLVPGTLKLDKKDVSKEPNVFVPQYRDIDIPAVVECIGGAQVAQFSVGATSYIGWMAFSANTPSPFDNDSFMTYGGGSDPSFNGDYGVSMPTGYPYPPPPPANPNVAYGLVAGAGRNASVTGGFLGSNDARFSPYAPAVVQHLSAQKMAIQQAPGVSGRPRIQRVYYDCGNSTFDQTNRLMKFERDRLLGTDIGAGWKAPICGTLSLYFECVDVNGARLPDLRVHDVITLDTWLTPEFTGDYEVLEIAITPPSENALGQMDLTLMAYNPAAPTDTSDSPGNYYASVPDAGLPLTGFTPALNPAWVLQGTPLGVLASDGTITITMPDLSVQVMGIAGKTAYPGFSIAEVPVGVPVVLYITDMSGIGTSPTYGFLTGSSFSTTSGDGTFLVMMGSFALPSGTGVGAPPVALIYSPLFG